MRHDAHPKAMRKLLILIFVLALVLLIALSLGCRKLKARKPEPADKLNPVVEIRQGDKRLKSGDLDTALAHYENAEAAARFKAVASYKKGVIFLRKGWFEQALEAFQEAALYDPENYQPFSGAARAALALGRRDTAQSLFEKSAALAPEDAASHAYLHALALARGDLVTAAKKRKKVLEIMGEKENEAEPLLAEALEAAGGPAPVAKTPLQKTPPLQVRTSPALGGTYFAILESSYRKPERAEVRFRELAPLIDNLYLARADLGPKGVWTRVLIGPYPNLREAKKEKRRLLGEKKLPTSVIFRFGPKP